MDPDETLRLALAAISKARQAGTDTGAIDHLWDLADHFEALDEWMTRGGFPPAQWTARGK